MNVGRSIITEKVFSLYIVYQLSPTLSLSTLATSCSFPATAYYTEIRLHDTTSQYFNTSNSSENNVRNILVLAVGAFRQPTLQLYLY